MHLFIFFFRSRHLHCDKQRCDEFIVLHLGYLAYSQYLINISFHDLESFHVRYNIKQLDFYVSYSDINYFFILTTFSLQLKTYNPDFTQIEVWFRLIFLIGAFGTTVSHPLIRNCNTYKQRIF